MAFKSDLGISPALLQAIQQTLASPPSHGADNGASQVKTFTDQNGQKIVFCNSQGQPLILKRSTTADQPPNETLMPPAANPVQEEPQQIMHVVQTSGDHGSYVVMTNSDHAVDEASGHQNVVVQFGGGGSGDQNEMMMGNVLSAIASQLKKDGSADKQHHHLLEHDPEQVQTEAEEEVMVIYPTVEGDDSNQEQLAASEGATHMAVANSEVVIAASEADQAIRYEGPDGRIYVIRDGEMVPDEAAPVAATATTATATEPSEWSAYVSQFADRGPCPICGDKVSGE